jgi:hypothetical protein
MKRLFHHSIHGAIAYLLIHALSLTAGAHAAGTTLHNIREGIHDNYTRVVLDCRGALPEDVGPARRQFLAVRFADLMVRADMEKISNRLRGSIRRIDLREAKAADEVRLLFQSPGLRVKTLLMKSGAAPDAPYRLVIDVFPEPDTAIKAETRAAAGNVPSGPAPVNLVAGKSKAVAAAAPDPALKSSEKAAGPASTEASTVQDTPQWTYSGEASLVLAAADGEDDSSKFEEYRDISQPVAGDVSFEAQRGNRLYLKGAAFNAGRDDPSVDAAAGRYGKYDMDFQYDRLVHRYAYDAKTLYSGIGSSVMTLDDTLQADVQAAPTSAIRR